MDELTDWQTDGLTVCLSDQLCDWLGVTKKNELIEWIVSNSIWDITVLWVDF